MTTAWFEEFEADKANSKVVPIWELWILGEGPPQPAKVRMAGFSRVAPDPPWFGSLVAV